MKVFFDYRKCLVFFLVLSIAVNAFYQSAAQSSITNNLELYLPLNGNALDATSNGNNGVIYGATNTTNKIGEPNSAVEFDGVNDYIAIPNSSSIGLAGEITISAQVYPLGVGTDCQTSTIIAKGNITTGGGAYGLHWSDNLFDGTCNIASPKNHNFYGLVQASTSSYITGTIAGQFGAAPYISDNKWYCVTMTCDGDSCKLYVNGALQNKWQNTYSAGTNADTLYIGKSGGAASYFAHAKIDEVRIYSRALNYQEVQAACELCSLDTIRKDIITTRDTLLNCSANPYPIATNLTSNDLFIWASNPALSSVTDTMPILNANTNTAIYVTKIHKGCNLIENGEFENGDTYFNTTYTYIAPITGGNTGGAQYTIDTSAVPWNIWGVNCDDHTTGNGQMLHINGSSAVGVNVWEKTITVTPGTNYAFGAWLCSWSTSSPAQLNFSINSVALGSVYTLTSTTCFWQRFYQVWNSGTATSATISLVNQNTALGGNDFSIDDIFFAVIDTVKDTLNVNVITAGTNFTNTVTSCNSYNWPANGTTYTTSGTYFNVSTNTITGCTDSAQLILTINNSANTINNVSACNQYFWGNNNTNYYQSGQYIATSTNAVTGCADTAKLALTINASSNTNDNISACGSYTWPITGITYSTSGTYNTITTNAVTACSDTSILNLTIINISTSAFTTEDTICGGASCSLIASATSNAIFQWQPSAGLLNSNTDNATASPSANTIYTVSASLGPCTATSTVSVVVLLPQPLIVTGDSAICNGQQTTITVFGAGSNLSWQPNTGNIAISGNQATLKPETTTTYTIFAKDINSCTQVTTKMVTVYLFPNLGASVSNTIQCDDTTALLTMTPATNYQWVPTNTLSNSTIANPIAKPLTSTTYTVLASNYSCAITDTVRVEVLGQSNSSIYIPSAFTPNYDGANDCFKLVNSPSITNYSCIIYNRYGQQVFSSSDPLQCWDGQSNAREGTDGCVFYYLIKGTTDCGAFSRQGDVMIIK
jgi:gliding motility-associated-like protein